MTARLRLPLAAVLLFCAGLALDQLTKNWAIDEVAGGRRVSVVPTVAFDLEFNTGAAFGLGADAGPVSSIVIGVVLAGLTTWVAWLLATGRADSRVLLLVAAAAGGWGNMYDRITRAAEVPLSGAVVDFIAVDWFAIFNVGDILTVGGLLGWAGLTALARPRARGVDRTEAGVSEGT